MQGLSTGNTAPVGSGEAWLRLLVGLALVFGLFQAAGRRPRQALQMLPRGPDSE
jgi:hypothetical protein